MTDFHALLALFYALAAWRASRFFIEDTLFEPVRERIWAKYPPETTKRGYLLTCFWCLGAWISLIFAILFIWGGIVGLVIALALAFSALVGLLQTLLDR